MRPADINRAKMALEHIKAARTLLKFIKWENLTGQKDYTLKQTLANLEKQKEQKPEDKEITLTNFEEVLNTFLFDFANSPIEDCEPKEYIKKHSAEILKAAYTELNAQLKQDIFEAQQEGRREGYEAAKAEQKPAEWSEDIIQKAIKEIGLTQHQIDWFKTNVFPPKQEWSEEDELMILTVIQTLETLGGRGTTGMQIDWLKSLRPQPKQEWSEEDEKVIRDACCWIAEYAGFLVSENKDKAEMLWKLSEKLKSLRPQPKQEWSEEDEKMLEEIINHIYTTSVQRIPARPGSDIGKSWIKFLKSLREVLLKVIREADSPGQMPCWRKAHNNYEDPCIGSAFEKTGRRYTALYMGGYFIDLDDLFNKLPKEQDL